MIKTVTSFILLVLGAEFIKLSHYLSSAVLSGAWLVQDSSEGVVSAPLYLLGLEPALATLALLPLVITLLLFQGGVVLATRSLLGTFVIDLIDWSLCYPDPMAFSKVFAFPDLSPVSLKAGFFVVSVSPPLYEAAPNGVCDSLFVLNDDLYVLLICFLIPSPQLLL